MAINPNNGVLDIINGTLKVSSIDIKQAGGFSTAINTVARNDVLLFDDQKSTTTFTPTAQGGYMSSTGVTRDTSSNYLELGTASDGGWVYWPLQLPNSWHTEFDMHVTATGGVLTFSLFNTSEPNHTNYANNDGGYKIVFDNTNNQIVIYWEGSVHKTVSATLRSNDWQSVNINYFQGAISVSLAGKVVLTHEFTENYQEFDSRYIGFSATAGTSHKIRHLRVHNSDKWLYTKTSNASDISYVSGNVGIGSLSPTELLDVHGNVHIAKNLTVDGNLTVTGTTTFIDSTNLAVEDPIIELARGNTSDTIDAGLIVSRSTSNVAVAYRGDEEELALGYTQSGASDTDVTPVANGGLDVRVYGNLFANNLTTTANVEATYLKGNVVTSNLTVSGNYTMGGDIIPDTNDAYDIGSAEKKIRDMYVSDNSLWVGDETKISFTGGKMRFRKRKKNVVPAAILTAGGTSAGAKSFAGKTDLNNIKIHEWLKYMRTLSGKSNAKMGDVFRDNNDDYEATTAAEAWKDMNDDVYTTSNVSVGKTTSPTVRLDVEGDGKFSGNVVTIGNIGISKTTPDANLHVMGYQYVNGPPTLTNAFDHSDAPLTLTHGTATSSTAINDPKPLLHLTRSGTNNESYGARASFNLSRYENSSTHSRSRLDVALADGTYAESTVMTLRADGKVGVGVTSPAYKLDVDGDLNLSTGSTLRINGTPAVFSNWTVSGSNIHRPSGNVGINNTTPAEKLDVVGNIKASGSIAGQSISLADNIVHTGDTSTSFGFPGTGTIDFFTAGSERMRIASSGNVGIGTNNPHAKLDIQGPGGGSSHLTLSGSGSTTKAVIYSGDTNDARLTLENTQGTWHTKCDSSGRYIIYGGHSSVSLGDRIAIKTNGNVGIGTTSPNKKLDILTDTDWDGIALRSTSNFHGYLSKDGNGCSLGMNESGNRKVYIRTNADSYFKGGNVGIGTDTVDAPLHIFKTATTASATGAGIKMERHDNYGCSIWSQFHESGGTMYDCMNFRVVSGSTDAYGGTPQMVLTQGGNLGIGMTMPSSKLEVLTDTDWDGIMLRSSTNLHGYLQKDSNGCSFGMNESGNRKVYIRTNAASYFTGGYVGIGTASPTINLDVFNSSHNTGYRQTTQFRVSNAADHSGWTRMIFGQVSTNNGFIDVSNQIDTKGNLLLQPYGGNVAIGRTSPDEKLDVDGNVRIRGATTQLSWNNSQRLIMKYDNSYRQGIHFEANSRLMRLFSTTNDSGGGIVFQTASGYGGSDTHYGSERMRITSDGNVGINDSSPSTKLSVQGSFRVHGNTSTFGYDGLLHINSRTTTYGSETVALQTTIDGRGLTESNPGTHGGESRNVLALQPDGGHVGIGTTGPGAKLHIETTGSSDVARFFRSNAGTGSPTTIHLGRNASTNDTAQLRYVYGGSSNNSNSRIDLGFYGNGSCLNITAARNVGINHTSPATNLHIYHNANYNDLLTIEGKTTSGDNAISGGIAFKHASTHATGYRGIRWYNTDNGNFLMGGVTMAVGGSYNNCMIAFHAARNKSSGSSRRAYIDSYGNGGDLNFTGQHRCFIKEIPFTQIENVEGLIVSADNNKYTKMSDGIEAGSNAITINESLPVVSLSNVATDKKCFGVISASEDPESRQDRYGNIVSVFEKEKGDTRVYINSVGEGAIWVTNANGNLESGDYITTSNVTGYGMKQDSEFLANYTVAKITMDCDFAPATQPVQQIVKELSNVNYWVETTYSNVALEEYSNLTEENRRTVTDNEIVTYQKIERKESKTEQEGWTLDVRQELVNVLDEHGQLQWEDHPTETEKAYKIRYLTNDGQITDEANAVHIAAFVGCTYHCG